MVLKPDEINIPLGQGETQLLTDSDSFLDGAYDIGSSNVSNTASYLGKGLLTYAAAGALPRVLRESYLPSYFMKEAQWDDNIIKGFYDKGMKAKDKLLLTFEHFGYGDPKAKSTILNAQKFISDYNDDIAFMKSGTGRNKGGHAISAMEELDTILGKEDGWKKVGRLKQFPGTNRFERIYDTTLDVNDPKLISRLEQAVVSPKLKYDTLAHMNHEVKLAHQYDLNSYGGGKHAIGTTQHDIRAEKLKTQLVKLVTDDNPDFEIMRQNGLSKPVKMNAGNFFKHHANMWPDLRAEDNITVSQLSNHTDHTKQVNAVRKSAQYKLARHVYATVDDLTDRKAVMKAAMDRAGSMGTSRFRDAADRLHPHSPGALKEVETFMKKYKLTPEGNLTINIGTEYKPHKTLGGTNANIIISSGKRKDSTVIKDTQSKLDSKKYNAIDNWKNLKYNRAPSRGIGTKIHEEILVTDMYDIAGSGLQKNKHITYAYANTRKGAKDAFNTNARQEVLPNRVKFVKAAQDGNMEDMIKYGQRTGSKVIKKTTERLTSRNPLTAGVGKVLGKVGLGALNATTAGKLLNIAGGVMTAAEIRRMAGNIYDNQVEANRLNDKDYNNLTSYFSPVGE